MATTPSPRPISDNGRENWELSWLFLHRTFTFSEKTFQIFFERIRLFWNRLNFIHYANIQTMTWSFSGQTSCDQGHVFKKRFIILMTIPQWYIHSIKDLINGKLMAPLDFSWSFGWDWPMRVSDVSSILGCGITNRSILAWKFRDNLSVTFRLWLLIKILSLTRNISFPSCYGLIVFRDPWIMSSGYPRTSTL
jgi:hypothetical protein